MAVLAMATIVRTEYASDPPHTPCLDVHVSVPGRGVTDFVHQFAIGTSMNSLISAVATAAKQIVTQEFGVTFGGNDSVRVFHPSDLTQ